MPKNLFIIFDLDDTLADTSHRQCILDQEFEEEKRTEKWDKFFEACDKDKPKEEVIYLLNNLSFDIGNRIEIWTGRSDLVLNKTKLWLTGYVFQFFFNQEISPIKLRMRKQGDFRHDIEIKSEWIEQYGRPDLVFDDRTSVVEWWRSLGITCLQVEKNDY